MGGHAALIPRAPPSSAPVRVDLRTVAPVSQSHLWGESSNSGFILSALPLKGRTTLGHATQVGQLPRGGYRFYLRAVLVYSVQHTRLAAWSFNYAASHELYSRWVRSTWRRRCSYATPPRTIRGDHWHHIKLAVTIYNGVTIAPHPLHRAGRATLPSYYSDALLQWV